MLVDRLLSQITSDELTRDFSNPLRASASGKCARAIAYQKHYPKDLAPLSSRARMVFRLGDTIENEIAALIATYVPRGAVVEMPDTQISLSATIEGVEIKGHIDGKATIDGKEYILECKSINGLGFKRVLKGEIGYSYECQANFYMHASGIHQTLFIFYNKDTSHIAEVVYNYDPKIWDEVVERFTKVIKSTPDNLPEREYKPLKSGKLPWQCSYCSAVRLCWPEHEVKFDDNGKPELIVATTCGKEAL